MIQVQAEQIKHRSPGHSLFHFLTRSTVDCGNSPFPNKVSVLRNYLEKGEAEDEGEARTLLAGSRRLPGPRLMLAHNLRARVAQTCPKQDPRLEQS